MTYTLTVHELAERTFRIEANTKAEALEIFETTAISDLDETESEVISRNVKGVELVDAAGDDLYCQCQDCEYICRESELKWPFDGPFERVSPGEIMPAGECPKCGALSQLRPSLFKIGEIRHKVGETLDVVQDLNTMEASIVANPPDTYATLDDLKEALSP